MTNAATSFPARPGPPRKRPQFGLRGLLVAVAGFGGLFALMNFLGTVGSVVLLWSALLVAAHVLGNCWGKRVGVLEAEDRPAEEDDDRPPSGRPPAQLRGSAELARPRLREDVGFTWAMIVTSAVGALSGGALGVAFLLSREGAQTSWATLAVGAPSAAVLGGLFGFMTSSFLNVTALALGQASAAAPPSRSR